MAASRGARPGRLASIILVTVVAAFVLMQASVAVAEEAAFDLGELQQKLYAGPVFKQKCYPCHMNIAQTNTSEIIFTHAYHIMMECDGCHPKFPHGEQGTQKPLMKTCFQCHGLNHGPQGLLGTGECDQCHRTPRGELRPAFHTPDWRGRPHVAPSQKELDTKCAMCHTQAQCDDCHLKEGVSWRPSKPMVYDAVDGCQSCHGSSNLRKVVQGGNHSFEVQGVDESVHKDLTCQQCHQDFKYTNGPDPTKVWTVNAGLACAGCHQQQKDKALNVTQTYYDSVHGKALIDQMSNGKELQSASCSSCHGGHYIKSTRKDSVAKAELHASAYRVCARCHPKEYQSYDDYYHGAAYKRGAADAPACWECHGTHDILNHTDASSTVSSANMPKTCAKCHKGSASSFAQGAKDLIHKRGEARDENWLVKQQNWLGELLGKIGIHLG